MGVVGVARVALDDLHRLIACAYVNKVGGVARAYFHSFSCMGTYEGGGDGGGEGGGGEGGGGEGGGGEGGGLGGNFVEAVVFSSTATFDGGGVERGNTCEKTTVSLFSTCSRFVQLAWKKHIAFVMSYVK